jgi:hypothetical protein
MSKNPFEEDSLVQHYEQWYEVGEGERVDWLEKELLSELLGGFSSVQSLLDIGCGTGHFTRYFATFLPSVVGLEGRKKTTIYDHAHFYSVGELSQLVRKSLSHRKNQVFWRTTLFPKLVPLKGSVLPFGGFIGMRVAFD